MSRVVQGVVAKRTVRLYCVAFERPLSRQDSHLNNSKPSLSLSCQSLQILSESGPGIQRFSIYCAAVVYSEYSTVPGLTRAREDCTISSGQNEIHVS